VLVLLGFVVLLLAVLFASWPGLDEPRNECREEPEPRERSEEKEPQVGDDGPGLTLAA
jgi:hypothetical protein